MDRLLIFVILTVFISLCHVKTSHAKCEYDTVACPCFIRYLPTDGDPSTNVLQRIVKAFEDGAERMCDKLDDLLECVVNNTKTCDGTETGSCKRRYEAMKTVNQKFCIDKKQELIANNHCINSTKVKDGLRVCASNLSSYTRERKPACELLQNTSQCVNEVLKQCPAVRQTLDDIVDMYLKNYYQVENCDLDHHDAAAVSLPALSFTLVCLMVSRILTVIW